MIDYDNLKIQAINLYDKGLINREIAKILNIHTETVRRWVAQAGKSRHRGLKSKISNEYFFDEINNEIKAYYLGWIMADANISIINGQYSLKLHISIEDSVLIDSFLFHIGSTNKTKFNEKLQSYYVSLTSKHMVEKLIDYGVVPNKSGKEIVPNIRKDLLNHFIRGYFDGDGTASCVIWRNKKVYRSGFCGGKKVLDTIQQTIGIYSKIYETNGTYQFLYGVDKTKKLYKFMYHNSNIWLERKRNKLEIICGNTEVISKPKNLLTP